MTFQFPLPYRLLFVLSLLFFSAVTQAQSYRNLIDAQLVRAKETYKWADSDIQEWVQTDQYTDAESGLTHVYLQQKLNNIIVYNAISIFAIKGNDILYFKPGLIAQLQDKVNSAQPSLNAQTALENAITYLGLTLTEPITLLSSNRNANTYTFDVSAISSSAVVVQLVYHQVGQSVRLCWDVSIEMKSQPHWWNIRIDAMTGLYVDKNDYTVSCQLHNPLDESALHDMMIPNTVTSIGAAPSYRVFALPLEAPSFGSRTLLTNPSSVIASPFAWHDIDGILGEEYSITRGNNVYAYEDINNDNIPGYSPDGGSSMTFDFPYTSTGTQAANQDASLTNLFFNCNKVHDYLYSLGFNELSGNFQKNNYGNGGAANDFVLAEGLDGGGTNNANFSTPPDGYSGRMQMYLWTGNPALCTNLTVSSSTFSGSMNATTATFSSIANVTGNVLLVNDGSGTLTDACSPIINSVAGKIALIDRGVCNYINKAQAAQSAGAVGVIIANNVSGTVPLMSGTPVLSIPCVSISLSDGNALKAALLGGVVNATISTCTTNPIDGSFDNGVVAHEYGHGVSNRLTGGPSQTSCLSNAEQGGEGWSDWLSLMMTLKPGDQGSNPRGIGTFAIGQSTNGVGIRRYPYSTNMSINPQTYADLASSTTVHQRGEIWCDAIWDMSWKLIDLLGISNNPTNTTAGNTLAMRLVLEGMKLQPCNPGFLDARDAILTADALLYNNAHRCAIWQAFAGRGMGFNAVQGSSAVVGDEVAGFNMPPFCLPPTQIPVAAFTSDSISISCGGMVHFTDQSVQAFNWNWNFGDQTASILQNPTHTFTAPGVYIVKLVVNNPLGVDSVTHIITVTPTFSVSVSATPTNLCSGNPVSLSASASGSSNRSYLVSSIPYAPLSGSATTVALTDDQMSTAKPIGFTFNFFGQNYSTFYVCSNGFITFSSGMPATVVYGEPLPQAALPNNLIALAWNDLNPQTAGSVISYFTSGIAPNRKLVVNYSTYHYLSASLPFVVQAILYEGTNIIDIHTTTISNVSSFDISATTTQGVENANGSVGVAVAGRNSAHVAATNDAYRFTPNIPYVYTWWPGNLNGPAQTVNPLSSTSYTVQVTDGTACMAPFVTPLLNVVPCPVALTINAYIEGYYIGGGLMQPVLYNEGVSSNMTLCDSIRIELHSAISPFSTIASANAVLQVNGSTTANFTIVPGLYYIVIKHRNGLQTWSANPVMITGSTATYSFSDALNKAYGATMKQVDLNHWAIYSGDLNNDENVDLLDGNLLENDISIFNFGYVLTDINGDGNVDLLDTPTLETNISNFIFSNHP